MRKLTKEQAAWLYAADRVEASLKADPKELYTSKERRRSEEFVRLVREKNGEDIDEIYTWKKINELFGF